VPLKQALPRLQPLWGLNKGFGGESQYETKGKPVLSGGKTADF
jgi:hypothetical protein